MPRTITITQHAVFVTLQDNSKHRVTDWLDWEDAIDTWEALDDQRRDALKVKGALAHGDQRVKYYEVRSENDPNYKDLPYLNLASGFKVLSREYKTDVAAAKGVLRPLGYTGHAGGYVRYEDKLVAQGWWSAAKNTGHPVVSLPGEQGYRAVVVRALQVKKVAR